MFVTRSATRGAWGALALALTATLGACSSSPHASVAAAAKQPSRATSPAAKIPVARVAPVPTRPCTTADVSIAPEHRNITNGVQIERFAVTTADPAGCTLSGELSLVPKGPLSAQIPGSTVDLALSQHDFPGDLNIVPPKPHPIALTAAKPASFYLAWFAASPVVCVQGTALGFNAPGDALYTDMRALNYSIGPICDGIFYVSSVF